MKPPKTIRRDRLEIRLDILRCAKYPVILTTIIRLANVQYRPLGAHIELLEELGLLMIEEVEIDNRRVNRRTLHQGTLQLFQTSKLGREILRELDENHLLRRLTSPYDKQR